MKLNKEGVEKAADVRSRRLFGAPLQDLSEDAQQVITGLVSDELTAYFDHLRQAGLMRVSDVKGRNSDEVVARRIIIRADEE
jgi:phage terminase large subunit GpA-like protein